jgi:2-dehydro-3-deoxyphosphooctonate aldolase (KDO 8-P synthase)
MNLQNIPQIKHLDSGNFFLLAGPCAIEGEEMAMRIAEKLVSVTDKLQIPYVLKVLSRKQIVQELIVFLELEMKKH